MIALLAGLALIGIGLPFTSLLPQSLQTHRELRWSIAPVLGFLIVVVVGQTLMSCRVDYRYIGAAVSVFSGFGYLLFRGELASFLRPSASSFGLFISLFGALCLIASVGVTNWLGFGTPFSVGPDGPMYAQMAHFLLSGKHPSQITHDPTHYTLIVNAGFNHHYRAGYPFYLAFVSQLTNAVHPHDVMIAASIALSATQSVLFAFFARYLWRLSAAWTILATMGLFFNSVHLGILYENQHPNVALMPVFLFMIVLFHDLMQAFEPQRERIRRATFFGFALAGILVFYSEILPLLGAYFVLAALTLAASKQTRPALKEALIMGFGGCAIGLALIGTHAPVVLKHLFTLNTSGAAVGYPQPVWIWPHELMGLGNMWAHYGYWTQDLGHPITRNRSSGEIALGLLLSAFIVLTIGLRLRKPRLDDSRWPLALWTPAVILLMAVLFRTRARQEHNYLYTKACFFFLPPLLLVWFQSLRNFPRLATLWVLVVALSGYAFFKSYRSRMEYVDHASLGISEAQLDKLILLPAKCGCPVLRGHTQQVLRQMYYYSFPKVVLLSNSTFCNQRELLEGRLDNKMMHERGQWIRRIPLEWDPGPWTPRELTKRKERCPELLHEISPCGGMPPN